VSRWTGTISTVTLSSSGGIGFRWVGRNTNTAPTTICRATEAAAPHRMSLPSASVFGRVDHEAVAPVCDMVTLASIQTGPGRCAVEAADLNVRDVDRVHESGVHGDAFDLGYAFPADDAAAGRAMMRGQHAVTLDIWHRHLRACHKGDLAWMM